MSDQRAAAFLREMGITLWTPRTADPVIPAEAGTPVPRYSPQGAPMPPTPARDMEAEGAAIAAMDWDQLHAAIATCTRCTACRPGKEPVPGTGDRQARWLVSAGATTAADERERMPLAGDTGVLLDNMLAAVQLSRADGAWITNLVKCRPTTPSGGDRAPTAQEASACRPYLERELALTGARTLLTLGQVAADAMLDKPLQTPLSDSRGTVHDVRGAAMVATLHPGELLRRSQDKALAWADLCLARDHGNAA